ncbi:hypothetical protein [Sphingobacterium micropteri]|nr:hypothetical protein [Sphingobacterium micropteri]
MHGRIASLHTGTSGKTIFITSPDGLVTFRCDNIVPLSDEPFE